MKKLFLIALSLLMTAGVLAACGKTPSETTGTTTEPDGSTTPRVTTSAVTSTSPVTSTATTTTPPPTVDQDFSNLPREAAAEGIVLLKNEDNLLPLTNQTEIALFGKGQVELIKGGTGSGNVNVEKVVGILEGLETKAAENKVKINESLADRYRKNVNFMPTPSIIKSAAKTAEIGVLVISRNSGEGGDRSATAGDYYLSANEIAQIENMIKAGFEDIVVILNIGGIMDTTELLSYPEIKSILLVWQPGMDGGNAIADVLVGDVTPSGKLSDTFAKSYDDYPTSATFHENNAYVNYTEDVYVGYRYFETFDPLYTTVNYEFGFGLSYTTFTVDEVKVSHDGSDITVNAKVTNTGKYSGKEVVQVYFSAPQGLLGKPAKELAGFCKTKTLAPGESEVVTITFPIADMSSYDDTGLVQKSAYLMEAGDYQIYVGNSIRNAGENGVRYTYTLANTQITEQLTEQLTAKLLEKRLKADGSYETIYDDSDIGIPLGTEPLKVEAEAYYTKHEHAQIQFNSNATICGLKIFTSDAGNRYVTFAFEVEKAGNYSLSLGLGNGGTALENAVSFYVNEVLQAGASLPIPRTGSEWTMTEVGSATISLKQGLNFVKIVFTKGDSYTGIFDYITIAYGEGSYTEPDTQDSSTVKASGVTTVQGESYTASHADVGTEEIAAGDDLGGITVKNLHSAGYTVTYKLTAEESGTYRIAMRVANGLDAASNACTLTVNGVAQPNFGYALPYTGVDGNQWFVFQTIDAGTITLEKGENTLVFTVVERMGNLDWFSLEKADTASVALESSALLSSASERVAALAAAQSISFSDLCADPSLMDAFLDQLTIEQLVYLLHGHGENIPEGTGSIGGIPELGIPSAETADGPAGIRLTTYGTAWPIETMLACTWNTDLLYRVGVAVAKEATEKKVDIWLAPGVNIHRNPLCGRNFEYYSEDPLLSGMMAAALINGVQDNGVGVAIKHFVGNEKETNRGHSDSRVSERALREIYLKPFEIAVKTAQPWLVMSSYNKVNGVETAENPELLTNILRNEWGFEGVVTTDWWNDSVEYKELLAGNDLKMKSGDEAGVLGAYKTGILTREDIELAVSRILTLIMKTNAVKRTSQENAIVISAEEKTVIRAVDAAWKSSEIGMEVCSDVGGTYNTTNTYEGQYLIFNIDVKESGQYTFTFRVASQNGTGAIRLSSDGRQLANFRNTLKTGDWQIWGDAPNVVTVTLSEGLHELRFDFTQGGFNINTITVEPK